MRARASSRYFRGLFVGESVSRFIRSNNSSLGFHIISSSGEKNEGDKTQHTELLLFFGQEVSSSSEEKKTNSPRAR
jgi:tRNA(Leu) C34 or U34 (ribose-2'-O)-methylase TrmL